jgi:hypothetical protein
MVACDSKNISGAGFSQSNRIDPVPMGFGLRRFEEKAQPRSVPT